ncbi:MAG: LacI family DNA-binding transcriptional regulator [Candidatus Omnitrophota bacterium]
MGITIKKIAEISGFGYGTVARALSDSPALVKKETREKITRVAEKYGYIRDINAQALVKGKTTDIGLILPVFFGSAFYNDYYIKLIAGVIKTTREYSHELRLLFLENVSGVPGIIKSVKSLKLSGIIYAAVFYEGFSRYYEHFRELGIPAVILNECVRGENIHSVLLDDFKGGYDGTQYLIKTGHRKIAVLRGRYKDIEDRYEGYKKAMSDYKIKTDKNLIFKGDGTESAGYRGTKEFLRNPISPTAIFALDDEMAIGALRALKEEGKRCPEDISILGYDGMDIGSFAIPRLTTMARPVAEMGKKAVQILMAKEQAGKCVKVEAVLFQKESCLEI